MKTMFTVLTAVSAIALASAAFAASPETKTTYEAKDNGGYVVDSKAKETTAAETDKSGEAKVDVSVDKDGSTEKTVTKTSETDPKGLMNAKSNKTKTMIKHKANGAMESKKVSKHTDAAGTDTKVESKTTVDANGNAVTETEKTVDPKGLMNSTTTKTKTAN